MTEQQPAAPQDFQKSVNEFRRPPIGPIIWLALVAVAGLFLALRAKGATAVAKCQGDAMSVGDVCQFTSGSRRTGRQRVVRDYDTALRLAERSLDGQVLGGLFAVVIALVLIVLVFVSWRRDLALLDGLQQENPEASHVDRGLFGTVLVGTIAAVVAYVAGYLFYRFQGGVAEWRTVPTVIAVVIMLVALVLLFAARPRGGTVLMVYPDGLGVLSRGKRLGAAFHDVHYLGDGVDAVNWVGSGRGNVDTNDSDAMAFRKVIFERVNQAWNATAPQRLAQGETLDFRALSLSRDGITIGKNFTPFSNITGIRTVKDKEGLYYELINAQGTGGARAVVGQVANVPVLRAVLRQVGLQLP